MKTSHMPASIPSNRPSSKLNIATVPQDRAAKVEWALWSAGNKPVRIFPAHWTKKDGSCSCGKPKTGDDRCRSPGKHPLISDNLIDATKKPEQIRQWWKQWPNANIGEVADPGHVWLDFDNKEAKEIVNEKTGRVTKVKVKNGIKSLITLMGSDEAKAVKTYKVRTTSGGYHWLEKTNGEPFKTCSNGPADGIDVRGQDGYVVGAGSTLWTEDADGKFTEKRYTIHSLAAPSMLPTKLAMNMPLLTDVELRNAERSDEAVGNLDTPGKIKCAVRTLRNFKPAIEGEGGNDRTYETFAALRGDGISFELALEMFMDWKIIPFIDKDGNEILISFNDWCDPPWDYSELINGPATNGYRYGKNRPGSEANLAERLDGGRSLEPEEIAKVRKDIEFRLSKPKAANSNEKSDKLDDDEDDDAFMPMSKEEQKNVPEPVYLLDLMFLRNAIAMVYGPSQTFKTFIVLSACLALSAGHHEWCGIRTGCKRDGRKMVVVYIAGEAADALIRYRKRAWLKQHGLTDDDVEFYPIVRNMPKFGETEQAKKFVRTMKRWNVKTSLTPDIIVVDTVTRSTAGNDVNASAAFTSMMENFSKIVIPAFDTRPAIIGIGHTGKDVARGMAGSYTIFGDSDTMIEFERPDKDKLVTRMTLRKQKDDKIGAVYGIKAKMVDIPASDIDGEPVVRAVPVFIERDDDTVAKVDTGEKQPETSSREDRYTVSVLRLICEAFERQEDLTEVEGKTAAKWKVEDDRRIEIEKLMVDGHTKRDAEKMATKKKADKSEGYRGLRRRFGKDERAFLFPPKGAPAYRVGWVPGAGNTAGRFTVRRYDPNTDVPGAQDRPESLLAAFDPDNPHDI